MESQNPRNKNNFFRYLPSCHLKCWKVNVYRDKRQVPFHIKMTCEQYAEEECAVWKSLGQTKQPCSHISFSLIFSQATEKEHLLQQEAKAFFFFSVQKCISEMRPCLTFIKLRGPRRWQMSFITLKAQHICCDNLFHLRNGICIWGGVGWTRIKIPILSSGFCYISS